MSKNSRLKGSFGKQHGKCAQTFLKCQGHILYHIHWSFLRQFSDKNSLLVIWKMSRLFIYTLSADGKYSLFNRYNLTQPIQMILSQKQKTFSHVFSAFLKSDLNFQHFQKKKRSLMSYVFPKVWIRKKLVSSMSKKSRFNLSFGKQHGKRARTLLKFAWHHLYRIYWSLWMQLTCKNFLLVTWKISRLFIHTLSADAKYSLFNRDNLTEPIQIQFSQKQETFSEFFSAFSKSSLNLEHFQKTKMSLIADVFPKLRTP